MKRSILFATDLSTNCQQAFGIACAVAKGWDAKLIIVYVDPSGSSAIGSPSAPRHWQANYIPDDPAIDYDHLLRDGEPAEKIVEVAHKASVDLIVLGTHGKKGLSRLFGGSVAEQIIRAAECPVLTLRQDNSISVRRGVEHPKILVPVDFSVYSYAALDFADKLAQVFDASITVVNVQPPFETEGSEEMRGKIMHQLRQFIPPKSSMKFACKILEGNASEEVARFANEGHFNCIVLGTHGRSGIKRMLLGSVAEHVVRDSKCAVVTVKPSNKRQPTVPARN